MPLKNQPGEYKKQQKSLRKIHQYQTNQMPSQPYEQHLAGFGLNAGKMQAGYYHNVLSNNPVSIESHLFNIGSQNLVVPQKSLHPKLNYLEEKNITKKLKTFIPEPLVVEKYQRPNGPFTSQ